MTDLPLTPSTTHVVPGIVPISTAIYEGSGPALVLIHGISSAGDVWSPVIDALTGHFVPITVDLRGHGESGKPEHGYLYDDYIGDLDRVLEHFGLERPLIIGHSLGGLIALWWAAGQPDRAAAMVIEDSPLRSGESFRQAFDTWLELNAMTPKQASAHYLHEHPMWKPEAARRRARQITSTERNVIEELKQDSIAHDGVDRIGEIEGITSPALLIHGDIESNGMVHQSDADDFAKRLPNATAHRIPGGNHGLHTDHYRAFLDAAIPFLREHAATASRLVIPTG